MQRIRFQFNKERNVYSSTRAISTTSEDVFVEYNGDNLETKVISALDGRVMRTLTSSSKKELKESIRNTLKEMGATIETEVRAKRNSAVESA